MKIPNQSCSVTGNASLSESPELGNLPSRHGHSHRLTMPGISHEIGLGDVIKKMTSSIGIKTCGGCERRAAALNRMLVFTPAEQR